MDTSIYITTVEAHMADKTIARVLLVDDEINFVKTLSARLKMRDLRVNTSTNGEDAVSKIAGQEYDAIVMDISAPDRINGLETAQRIKKINPSIPIIALTCHNSIEMCAKAIKIGASDFLVKPVQVGKLVQKIAAAKLHGKKKPQKSLARPVLAQAVPSFG